MTAWSYRNSCPRGDHLPPVSVSDYLQQRVNGKRRVTNFLELNYTETGVPDPHAIVQQVLATVNPSYEWPAWTNIHHFAYPRRAYMSDIEVEYRESPTLKAVEQIQFHNYKHTITEPPVKPPLDVMQARVEEDRAAHTLYQLAHTALMLDNSAKTIVRQAGTREDMRWARDHAQHYENLRDMNISSYYHMLDTTKPGMFGLVPDLEWLATSSVANITSRLGQVAAIDALDFRKMIQLAPALRAS